MIDIHCHLLYGLDDGARTREDSLAMMRVAAEHGTTDLVATPHASPDFAFDPQRIEERLTDLAAAADGALRLYPGCDFHFTYDNIQDAIAHPAKYAINHKTYLLVEFSELLIFHNTAEIFGRLKQAGLIPIVTHPERNPLLRRRIEELAKWVEGGAFVQITGQSLTGKFGRKARDFCQTLLERGMVHFAASDGHDSDQRPPRLDETYDWLAQNCDEPTAELLCVTNPRAAVEGEIVQPMHSRPRRRTLLEKWRRFWRL